MSISVPWWRRFFSARKGTKIDRYSLDVVTSPAELVLNDSLPLEIRYVLAVKPSRFETFRGILEAGYGIGVRSVGNTPDRMLVAVDRISRLTQHNTIVPWLPNLLRNEELPVFSEHELREAEEKGVNLYEEAKLILEKRFEFKKIILVDLHNNCISETQRQLMHEVNEDLYPLAIDAIVHRVVFDNAHTRTEVAQTVIKALIIIGPIAHVLEHALSGLGKIFAASADDVLSEVAELFALRGSGFTWRQLIKRSRILVPVFIAATYGAFQVEPLLEAGRPMAAGVVFGLSAVALSLVTAIQSIFMYRGSYVALCDEKKMALKTGESLSRWAFKQDFLNPARLGLFLGAMCSPLVAAVVFSLFPELSKNGWILAALGSTESIIASLAVYNAKFIEKAWFRHKILGAMRKMG
ncbi:MAG: hypothetical protein RDU25_05050 [Patescibacteria group bacterium]|nr:hypothetical protein [Patescibacteria group bacterium]